MASLAQFSRNMRKRSAQVGNARTKIVVAGAIRFVEEAAKGTPVDKGLHRSNWRVGLGQPTRAVIPPYAPGRNLGIGETANLRATISAARARLATVRPGRGRTLTLGIFVSNNAPGITKLNSGSSAQSAAGFIERATLLARNTIANFRIFER